MQKIRLEITMSLDGCVAGPNPSAAHPLGEGGEELHKWMFAVRSFRAIHGMERGATGPVRTTTSSLGISRTSGQPSWAATCSAVVMAYGETIPGTAGGERIHPSCALLRTSL